MIPEEAGQPKTAEKVTCRLCANFRKISPPDSMRPSCGQFPTLMSLENGENTEACGGFVYAPAAIPRTPEQELEAAKTAGAADAQAIMLRALEPLAEEVMEAKFAFSQLDAWFDKVSASKPHSLAQLGRNLGEVSNMLNDLAREHSEEGEKESTEEN
jgi:hypothetical protein